MKAPRSQKPDTLMFWFLALTLMEHMLTCDTGLSQKNVCVRV